MSESVVDSYTTSYHPREVGCSKTTLLVDLFQLEPLPNWGDRSFPAVLDESRNAIRCHHGMEYQNFDFLPYRISIRPEDWRLQWYTDRAHPACGTRDLHFRMHEIEGANETLLTANAINMKKTRFRKQWNMPTWTRQPEIPTQLECLMLEQLPWSSVKQNTIALVTSSNIVLPDSRCFPLGTFTGGQANHIPSTRLQRVYEVIGDLQSRAHIKGYVHWIFLENRYKPDPWIARRGQKASNTGPNDISVPHSSDLPLLAMEWIESLVRDAVASDNLRPTIDRHPLHAQKWIRTIIDDIKNGVLSSVPKESRSEFFSDEDMPYAVQKAKETLEVCTKNIESPLEQDNFIWLTGEKDDTKFIIPIYSVDHKHNAIVAANMDRELRLGQYSSDLSMRERGSCAGGPSSLVADYALDDIEQHFISPEDALPEVDEMEFS